MAGTQECAIGAAIPQSSPDCVSGRGRKRAGIGLIGEYVREERRAREGRKRIRMQD